MNLSFNIPYKHRWETTKKKQGKYKILLWYVSPTSRNTMKTNTKHLNVSSKLKDITRSDSSQTVTLYKYLHGCHITTSCTQMRPDCYLYRCLKLTGVSSTWSTPFLTSSSPHALFLNLWTERAAALWQIIPALSVQHISYSKTCSSLFHTNSHSMRNFLCLSPFKSRGKSSLTFNNAGVF